MLGCLSSSWVTFYGKVAGHADLIKVPIPLTTSPPKGRLSRWACSGELGPGLPGKRRPGNIRDSPTGLREADCRELRSCQGASSALNHVCLGLASTPQMLPLPNPACRHRVPGQSTRGAEPWSTGAASSFSCKGCGDPSAHLSGSHASAPVMESEPLPSVWSAPQARATPQRAHRAVT